MNTTPEYYLCGIDAGGTGCRTLISSCDGAHEVITHGGPSNFRTDRNRACRTIIDTVNEALEKLGSNRPRLEELSVHIGMAGIVGRTDAELLRKQLPFDICSITDDRSTTAVGALGEKQGTVVAIGTGSFFATHHNQKTKFFGGWGLSAGDQASGAWLGRGLFEVTFLAIDGFIPHSDLTRKIMAQFNESSLDILNFTCNARPEDFAIYARRIASHAKDGDAVGRRLMERGASYIERALQHLVTNKEDIICLMGGLGPHYESYLSPKYRNQIAKAQGNALDGARTLAHKNLINKGLSQ